MNVDLSVVIPVHNGAATIEGALDSLTRQDDAPSIEIIVADNRSDDALADVVARFSRDCPVPVRLVPAHEAQGAAHARNVGAAHARGELLVFCDCDDLYDPLFLAAMTEALRSADIAAADHERPEEYEAGRSSRPAATRGEPYPPESALLGYLPTGGGGGLGVRKSFWRSVGGFDNSYRQGAEDNDFYWRVQEAGGSFVAVPRAIVVYRHRATWRGTFRQYRSYRRGATLLQARFPAGVTEPVTVRGSLKHLAQTLLSAPQHLRSAGGRRSLAAQLGGITGSLDGLARHQLLGRVPERSLMDR